MFQEKIRSVNNYWKVKRDGFGHPTYYGKLIGDLDNFKELVECAEKSGIPKDKWHLITNELNYNCCYYEGDSREIVWKFPLSVFD